MRRLMMAVTALAALAAFQPQSMAQASTDGKVHTVRCTTDFGLIVDIDYYPELQTHFARIVQKAGPESSPAVRSVGFQRLKNPVPVERRNTDSLQIWEGRGFRLAITLESFIPIPEGEEHGAKLVAELEDGSHYVADLGCVPAP